MGYTFRVALNALEKLLCHKLPIGGLQQRPEVKGSTSI